MDQEIKTCQEIEKKEVMFNLLELGKSWIEKVQEHICLTTLMGAINISEL